MQAILIVPSEGVTLGGHAFSVGELWSQCNYTNVPTSTVTHT